MSVLEALMGVIPVQLATTVLEVIPALATLGTQAMDFLAQVSADVCNRFTVFHSFSFRIVS